MSKKINVQEIVDLYSQNTSISEISRLTGYSKTTVIKHLKEQGVHEDRNPKIPTKEIIKRYRDDNQSITVIAKDLNLSQTTVRKHLVDNNVKLRVHTCDPDKVIELYQEGYLIKDICKITGYCENSISVALDKAGIEKTNHLKNLDPDEVLEYYNQTKSLVDTCHKFDSGSQYIKKILFSKGVTEFKKRWDPSNDKEVIELYESGLSASAIAKQFDSSHRTILERLHKNAIQTRKRHELKTTGFTGYKEIYGSKWANIQNGAKARNLVFDLTIEYAWSLYESQDHKCALSGADISFAKSHLGYSSGDGTASLDRIDSSKGYIEGNVQWVHKTVNIMKQNLSDEEFIEWCGKIYNFSKEA